MEDGLAARTMAVYIDLNPVRAGIAWQWRGSGREALERAGLAQLDRLDKRARSLNGASGTAHSIPAVRPAVARC